MSESAMGHVVDDTTAPKVSGPNLSHVLNGGTTALPEKQAYKNNFEAYCSGAPPPHSFKNLYWGVE